MNKEQVLSQIIHPKVMNEKEESFVNRLVTAKVLDNPDKHHFGNKFASVILCCPDGTKISRTQTLLRNMYDKNLRKYVQPHLLTHHGGALLLAPGSMIVKPGHTTDADMMEQIKMSNSMGYKSIIAMVHFPCAMARMHEMSPMAMLDALVCAKKRIKETVADVTVACFVHCTTAGNSPEEFTESLYFFSKSWYLYWKKENPYSSRFD